MVVVLVSPLAIRLLLMLCFSCRVVHCQQMILFVKTKSSSLCTDDVMSTSDSQTLDWYSNNSNSSFTSNTEMLFQAGIHSLSTFIKANDCHNFTMTGSGSALHSSDALPQPTSIINCNGSSNSGLYFSNSSNIRVRNLELRSCGGPYYALKDSSHKFAGSLIFNLVKDISLDQVVINNTMGYGLHTSDISGTNRVLDSAFLRNSGNALFYFGEDFLSTDSTVLIVELSWFMYGGSKETFNVAGGLNVNIHCPRVHLTIVNVTMKGNIGVNGGNVALHLVAFLTNSSKIAINQSYILHGRAGNGGGLIVKLWTKQNPRFGPIANTQQSISQGINHIVLTNILFLNNSVSQTGGAMYATYYDSGNRWLIDIKVSISNCNFTDNFGSGAAMEITQHSLSYHRMTPIFQTSIERCIFRNNFRPPDVDGPILNFNSVEVSVTDSTFTGSNGTVLTLRNTYLHLFGDVLLDSNVARVGGAMRVCEASLVFVHNGTHVSFINNTAQIGGAIYVQQPCTSTAPLCFIQPAIPETALPIDFYKLTRVEFINNSATIAGDALYGGDLDTCTTISPYSWNTPQQHNCNLSSQIARIFDAHQQQGPSSISSRPRRVCFCLKSQRYHYNGNNSCIRYKDPVKKYPGEEFTISVITVGQMNAPTSGTINASLVDEDYRGHSLVKRNHPEPKITCTDLTYALNSNRTTAEIVFKPVTCTSPESGTHNDVVNLNLTVHLLRCPLGFQLTDTPPYKCVCSPLLTAFSPQVICNVNNLTISVPERRIWFGCFDLEQQSLTCNSLVVTPNCAYFCRTPAEIINGKVVQISIRDNDSQCSSGHTGIMCGGCKPGYSRVFGGPFECQKDCTNTNLPFILFAFFSSGILLIIIIMALNLTVTEGTLNGLLVYSMVIQTHRSYLIPEDPSALGRFCWVFTAWINLTFGIKTCFYRGMDGYKQIWILFVQVFYFLFVLVLIILLSRNFIFFTRLFGRSALKVLATLAFLLYSNLMFATFITFRYATLHISTSNGTQYSKLVWYYDGNVPYLGLKHALLFVTALICSIFMLFYVLSLLLIQCLQKWSDLWCLHWVERLRPFYEAYTGPCRDNYRFWPGFLLFMRTGLYIIHSIIPTYTDAFFRVKMFITASILIMVMSLACIFPRGVYKKWPLNILEFSFYLNLCITSGFLAFNHNRHQNISAVYTSVSISALTFIGILLYHFCCQIKNTTGWKKLTTWCSVQVRSVSFHRKQSKTKSNNEASLLPQVMPHVRLIKLNEPLVEA